MPKAGRLMIACTHLSDLAASTRAGWLYPIGMDEIWPYMSRRVFPSASTT